MEKRYKEKMFYPYKSMKVKFETETPNLIYALDAFSSYGFIPFATDTNNVRINLRLVCTEDMANRYFGAVSRSIAGNKGRFWFNVMNFDRHIILTNKEFFRRVEGSKEYVVKDEMKAKLPLTREEIKSLANFQANCLHAYSDEFFNELYDLVGTDNIKSDKSLDLKIINILHLYSPEKDKDCRDQQVKDFNACVDSILNEYSELMK